MPDVSASETDRSGRHVEIAVDVECHTKLNIDKPGHKHPGSPVFLYKCNLHNTSTCRQFAVQLRSHFTRNMPSFSPFCPSLFSKENCRPVGKETAQTAQTQAASQAAARHVTAMSTREIGTSPKAPMSLVRSTGASGGQQLEVGTRWNQ